VDRHADNEVERVGVVEPMNFATEFCDRIFDVILKRGVVRISYVMVLQSVCLADISICCLSEVFWE
jgi:hypothetical protein